MKTVTNNDLRKEVEIFCEIVSDILKKDQTTEMSAFEIAEVHERGRDEVIKALQSELTSLRKTHEEFKELVKKERETRKQLNAPLYISE